MKNGGIAMKRLLVLSLALLMACSLPAFGQKNKFKQKTFEPVVKQNFEDYAGKYSGPDAEHYAEVRVDAEGRWIVTVNDGPRRATLKNVKVNNARLTGLKVYADGSTQEFEAVFGNRVLNGVRDFGMLVEMNWEVAPGVKLQSVFFRRE
jgi:hypothetical protein